MKKFFLLLMSIPVLAQAQELDVKDPWLVLDATGNDPLYNTYTAAMERSRLYGDKGYKMDYWSTERPVSYASDQAGKMYCIWKCRQVVVNKIPEYHTKPVVVASFPDMALLRYSPWPGLEVEECFFVYSSSTAIVDMQITNLGPEAIDLELYPVIEFGQDSLLPFIFDEKTNTYLAVHRESHKRLISNLYRGGDYPVKCFNEFTASREVYSYGAYKGPPEDFYNIIKTDFYAENRDDRLNSSMDYARYMALHIKLEVMAGESINVRYLRTIDPMPDDRDAVPDLEDDITDNPATDLNPSERDNLLTMDLQPYLDENIELFRSVPRPERMTRAEKIMYIGAFNLVRGCMLPPSGQTSHNFYVFPGSPSGDGGTGTRYFMSRSPCWPMPTSMRNRHRRASACTWNNSGRMASSPTATARGAGANTRTTAASTATPWLPPLHPSLTGSTMKSTR